MNQTVSEKTTVDYLFVVQNAEPKHFVFLDVLVYKAFKDILSKNLFIKTSHYHLVLTKILINFTNKKILKGQNRYFIYYIFIV